MCVYWLLSFFPHATYIHIYICIRDVIHYTYPCRYFYLADPNGGNGGDKEASELWSFAASVLPRIHECSNDVADVIKANTMIGSTDAPMSSGYVDLKAQLESTYSCMGISCSQVCVCVCSMYAVLLCRSHHVHNIYFCLKSMHINLSKCVSGFNFWNTGT